MLAAMRLLATMIKVILMLTLRRTGMAVLVVMAPAMMMTIMISDTSLPLLCINKLRVEKTQYRDTDSAG